MSLVNQMLRDLQERKATDSKPLTGLHAVSAGSRAESAGVKHGWIVAASIASIAIVMALWWQTTDSTSDDPPQRETAVVAAPVQAVAQPQPDVQDTAKPVAAVEYPSLESLRAYRLDYSLKSPPRSMPPNSGLHRQKQVATSKPRKAVVPKVADAVMADTTDVAVKQVVAPVIRLRRDGLAALRAGRAVAAGQLFAQLVIADPVNPEAHLLLHAALKAQSRDGEAQAALLQGLNETSDPSQLAQVLAHEMLAQGRVDSALALLVTHRPDDGDELDYEALLAAVNQRAGNHTVAAELYELLVASQPANGDWWVGLAISQEAQGLVGEATKSFATASASGTLDRRLARYAAQRLARLEQGS